MGFRPGFGTNQYQCQHFKKNLAPAFSFFVWGYLSAPWVQDEAQTHITGITEHSHVRIWTFDHAYHKSKYTEHTAIIFRFGILLR